MTKGKLIIIPANVLSSNISSLAIQTRIASLIWTNNFQLEK